MSARGPGGRSPLPRSGGVEARGDAGRLRPPRRRWTPARRVVQLAVALLFLALPVLNALGFHRVSGTLVGLGVDGWAIAEPASALSALLAAGGAGAAGLLLAALPFAVLALVLGPVFCSWLCPFGLASEELDRLRRGRRARWPREAFARVRRPRALALALLLGGSLATGAPLAAVVAGPRLATVLPLEAVFLRIVPVFTGALLLALLALELLGPRRLWCRALCPAGALANYLRTPRTLTVAFDPARCGCTGTPACHTLCPWGVDPRAMRRLDGCTSCLRCVEACPTGGLHPRFGAPPASRPARAR